MGLHDPRRVRPRSWSGAPPITTVTSPNGPRAIGVDGAPGGWVTASLRPDSDVELHFSELFSSIVASTRPGDVIVVDMPIGLPDDGHRSVDSEVRERLGPRRSTFFPTPARSILDCQDWEHANTHSKNTYGKGLSKQAWNLVPKIGEVDEAWTLELRRQLREGHPETSFAEMAGGPLRSKKNTTNGRTERIGLLTTAISPSISAVLASFPKKWLTDAIDALAMAWTAQRVLSGAAIQLGGELDSLDRPMELVI